MDAKSNLFLICLQDVSDSVILLETKFRAKETPKLDCRTIVVFVLNNVRADNL